MLWASIFEDEDSDDTHPRQLHHDRQFLHQDSHQDPEPFPYSAGVLADDEEEVLSAAPLPDGSSSQPHHLRSLQAPPHSSSRKPSRPSRSHQTFDPDWADDDSDPGTDVDPICMPTPRMSRAERKAGLRHKSSINSFTSDRRAQPLPRSDQPGLRNSRSYPNPPFICCALAFSSPSSSVLLWLITVV